MDLQTYSKEELKDMPMIDIAYQILLDEKEALHFKEVFQQIAEIKGFTEEQRKELIAQFYTDLNIDGRFITTGSNLWGLKRRYPADQIDERVSNPSKRRKKTKDDEEEDEDDLDIVDDEMDELIEDFADDEEDEELFEEDDDDFEKVEKEEFPTYDNEDDDEDL